MNNPAGFLKKAVILAGILVALRASGQTQKAAITVQADQVLPPNPPYPTGPASKM
jgi:hypothetical protein